MSDEDQSKDYLPSEDDQNLLESSDDSSSKEADSEKEDSKESFQVFVQEILQSINYCL